MRGAAAKACRLSTCPGRLRSPKKRCFSPRRECASCTNSGRPRDHRLCTDQRVRLVLHDELRDRRRVCRHRNMPGVQRSRMSVNIVRRLPREQRDMTAVMWASARPEDLRVRRCLLRGAAPQAAARSVWTSACRIIGPPLQRAPGLSGVCGASVKASASMASLCLLRRLCLGWPTCSLGHSSAVSLVRLAIAPEFSAVVPCATSRV